MEKTLVVVLVNIDRDVKLNFIGCIFVLLYSLKNMVQSFDTLLYRMSKVWNISVDANLNEFQSKLIPNIH